MASDAITSKKSHSSLNFVTEDMDFFGIKIQFCNSKDAYSETINPENKPLFDGLIRKITHYFTDLIRIIRHYFTD